MLFCLDFARHADWRKNIETGTRCHDATFQSPIEFYQNTPQIAMLLSEGFYIRSRQEDDEVPPLPNMPGIARQKLGKLAVSCG